MVKALVRRRRLLALALIFVIVTYGGVVIVFGQSAAKTAGIGYCAVMVTLGILLLVCDLAERDTDKVSRAGR